MRILDTEPLSVLLSKTKLYKHLKNHVPKVSKRAEAKMDGVMNQQNCNCNQFNSKMIQSQSLIIKEQYVNEKIEKTISILFIFPLFMNMNLYVTLAFMVFWLPLKSTDFFIRSEILCKTQCDSIYGKTPLVFYNSAIRKKYPKSETPTVSILCEFYRVPSSFAVVFIGVQGSGKSATANSFLGGGKYFKSRSGTIQCTTECASREIQTSKDFKDVLHVIDTPPLNHVEDFENIKRYVASRKFTAVQYIIVIKTGRFSSDELSMLKKWHEKYASDIEKKSIIVFSNAAELEVCENNQESITLDMYVQESERLRQFLKSVVHKYFGIDNVNWNSERKAEYVRNVLQSFGFLMDSAKSCTDTAENLCSNTPCDNTEQFLPSQCCNIEQCLPSPCDNTKQSLSQIDTDLTTDAEETELQFEIVNPKDCE